MRVKPFITKRSLLLIGAIVLTAGITVVITMLVLRSAASVLPTDISRDITFSPLVPANSSNYKATDYMIGKNESGAQILTYNLYSPAQKKVVISEQSQPQEFTDIPEYKDKFLENKKDATVASASGTIYLFRGTKQTNKEAGLMLENGLLIFLNPETPLSKDEWRAIGDQLSLQRIKK